MSPFVSLPDEPREARARVRAAYLAVARAMNDLDDARHALDRGDIAKARRHWTSALTAVRDLVDVVTGPGGPT